MKDKTWGTEELPTQVEKNPWDEISDTDPCNWKLADSEHSYWHTSCGVDWWFEDSSLSEIKYCMNCGGKVVDVTNYCTRCNWVIDEPGMCGSCEDTVADEKQDFTNRPPE